MYLNVDESDADVEEVEMGIRLHDSKGKIFGRCLPCILSCYSYDSKSILLEVSFHTFKVGEVCSNFESWINANKMEIIGHEYTKEDYEGNFRVESFHDYLPYERTIKHQISAWDRSEFFAESTKSGSLFWI